MKKIFTSSFLLLTFPFLAARAELLYFMADTDTTGWQTPETFDFALIGVAKYVDNAWTATWGADGSRMYLHLYDTAESTLGSSAAATKAQVLADFGSYARGSDALETTAVGWADVSDYTTDDYRFYIEVYADGKGYDFMEAAQTYERLLAANHIYASGMTDPQPVTPWTVPEPSSALLALVGVGLAAWRRRRRPFRSARDSRAHPRTACARESRALRMILHLFTSSFFLLTFPFLSAFADADDTLISFSTKGPDTYLDGTAVKDGECYALVWTRSGASFEGLAADGTVVGTNSAVVVFAPVAKNGHCPPVLFELDAAFAKNYAGGSFGVYLLDTRLASGAVGGTKANGAPVAVNGWGVVDAESLPRQNGEEDSALARQDASPTGSRISVTTRSALPANTPQPTITSIRLAGDNVILTVKGTLPCLRYKAQPVDAKSVRVPVDAESLPRQNEENTVLIGRGEGAASTERGEGTASTAQGADTPDDEITIIVPKTGDSGLYSVQRD